MLALIKGNVYEGGYSPEQVKPTATMTIGNLIEELTYIVETYGAETPVVIMTNDRGYNSYAVSAVDEFDSDTADDD